MPLQFARIALSFCSKLGGFAIVKVFISWSGKPSKAVAEALYCWLPQVIQAVIPWMSAEDISAGARWSAAIAAELETARFGIICVTPSNLNAPWLQFEAGALSKTIADTFVCPYTFGLAPTALNGPLAQFHGARADREGTHRLLRAINLAAGDKSLPIPQLDAAFKVWWPRLQKALANIENSSNLAFTPVPDENHVLKEILEHVRNLAPRPTIELYFLVSFGPSSGVGVYEFEKTTYRFVVESNGDNSTVQKLSLEGQVAAGYYFSSLKELLSFCKREYFAAKKGAYYSTLFTKSLTRRQSAKVLQFLNQPSFSEASISAVVVSALKEIANVKRVAEAVLRAHELALENVKACLFDELGEIVLAEPILSVLKNMSEGTAATASFIEAKKVPARERQ